MAAEPIRIHVNKETAIGDVLAEAAKAPVLVEKDGMVYRVSPEPEDLSAGYDPDAVRRALKRSAGAFTGMDTTRFKEELREQRAQDSQGRPA